MGSDEDSHLQKPWGNVTKWVGAVPTGTPRFPSAAKRSKLRLCGLNNQASGRSHAKSIDSLIEHSRKHMQSYPEKQQTMKGW